MTNTFLNLAKDINIHIQEVQQTTNRLNPKKTTFRDHKVIKNKYNEKILKAAREYYHITYAQGNIDKNYF